MGKRNYEFKIRDSYSGGATFLIEPRKEAQFHQSGFGDGHGRFDFMHMTSEDLQALSFLVTGRIAAAQEAAETGAI